MPGADPDIVAPLAKRVEKRYDKILLKTKVTKVEAKDDGLHVSYEGPERREDRTIFDAMLVSVGRRPNGKAIGAEAAGVDGRRARLHRRRQADAHQRPPHLRHRRHRRPADAGAQGARTRARWRPKSRPATRRRSTPRPSPPSPIPIRRSPGSASTETELKAKGVKYGKAVFPWAASGRSLSLGRDEGVTKTLWDEETQRLIGCGIVGPNAGDLISEAALAIEMGAEAEDIGLTIHPHPTLSETFAMSAEAFAGTLTDLYMPKKK